MGELTNRDGLGPGMITMASVSVERVEDPGGDVYRILLQNNNTRVELTNIGCSIMAIHVPDKFGKSSNIVAGYSNPLDYLDNPHYFGCIIGRYANRISLGCFEMEGKKYQLPVNNGNNHLHGGVVGLGRRVWKIDQSVEKDDVCGIAFSYTSPDGEEAYPGNLSMKVSYELEAGGSLRITYEASTDQPTPVSLSNHSYFNLSGFDPGHIYDHQLMINANSFTQKSLNNTPTGEIIPVLDSSLDFTAAKRIGERINSFDADKGYDHNFVLKNSNCNELVEAAVLSDTGSGRIMKVYTDRPGIQLYTANFWDGTICGSHGVGYQQHGAVALETQAFPDSPNHPHFPNTILQPGETFVSTTIYQFGLLDDIV